MTFITGLLLILIAGPLAWRIIAGINFRRHLRACAADCKLHFPRLHITPGELAIFDARESCEHQGFALLLHGWELFDPRGYSQLIEKLNSSGYTVLFPFYQQNFFLTDFKRRIRQVLDSKLPGWRENINVIVGHSGGASVAVDLFLSEAGLLEPKTIVLLSPGDGSGPNGERPAPLFRLKWKQEDRKKLVLPQRRPVISIITASDDTVTGNWVADKIYEYLHSVDSELVIMRDIISSVNDEELGHFFPMGGCSTYQLPKILQRLCKTDSYGGCGEGWPATRIKDDFWKQFQALLAPEAALDVINFPRKSQLSASHRVRQIENRKSF